MDAMVAGRHENRFVPPGQLYTPISIKTYITEQNKRVIGFALFSSLLFFCSLLIGSALFPFLL
jgi:hypothetical protein